MPKRGSWGPLKAEIQYFHRAGIRLRDIAEHCRIHHGFYREERQWQNQLRRWGMSRYGRSSTSTRRSAPVVIDFNPRICASVFFDEPEDSCSPNKILKQRDEEDDSGSGAGNTGSKFGGCAAPSDKSRLNQLNQAGKQDSHEKNSSKSRACKEYDWDDNKDLLSLEQISIQDIWYMASSADFGASYFENAFETTVQAQTSAEKLPDFDFDAWSFDHLFPDHYSFSHYHFQV